MKVERLISIIFILLRMKKVTASYLSDTFGVSKRTIYRDIETLENAGIPIVSFQGTDGGFELVDGFKIDRTFLSTKEASTIISVLNGIKNVVEDVDIENLYQKLNGVDAEGSNFYLDLRSWGMSQDTREKANKINMAISSKRLIAFEYVNNFGEHSNRRVGPVKIVLKASSWYLYAFCDLKKDYRVFKISRIRKLEVLDEKFEQPEDSTDYSVLFDKWENVKNTKIILKFSNMTSSTMQDFFIDEKILERNDEYSIVEVNYPVDNWVYGFILSFGEFVEVLEPEWLKKNIEKKIEKMREIYLNKPDANCHHSAL